MCELRLEGDGLGHEPMLFLDGELTDEDRMAVAKLFPRGYKQERPWVSHVLRTHHTHRLIAPAYESYAASD